MIEDSRLKVFLAVAREGSFTIAARKLGISQPAVSQNVAELEKSLGVELFERSRGSVRLTSAGHTFQEYASRIQHWYSAVEDLFGEKGRLSSRGQVRIAADSFVAGYILPSLLGKLLVAAPELSFRVCPGRGEEYDVLFRTAPHTEELSFEASSGYAGTVSAAAVTANASYSGIQELRNLPGGVRFVVWEPYMPLLPLDIKVKVSLVTSSLALIGEMLSADPKKIGLLPLEAAPSGLSRMPVSLRSLELDLFVEPSEGFKGDPAYNSLRNLAIEARKSAL